MSYIDLKISDQEAGANNVQSAPNVLIKTPQENKAVFDALPDIVRQRFNSLIDELTQGGYLPLQGQEDLIIRINSTNGKMEFSLDAGQTWQASANEGHRILTSDGTVMPQRSDLRFEGANVRTEENQTIVNFQSGAQGIPTGGSTGQVLKKVSNESYDADWADTANDSEKLGGVLASDFMRTSQNQSLIEHPNNKNNPHDLTAAKLGLGNVDNTRDAQKTVLNSSQLGGVASSGYLKTTGGTLASTVNMTNGGLYNVIDKQTGNSLAWGFGHSVPGVAYEVTTSRFKIKSWAYVDCILTDETAFIPCRASTFTPMSSIKFKKNVKDLMLEKAKNLLQLRPVEYELNKPQVGIVEDVKTKSVTEVKLTSDTEYGFIAEEVAEIDDTFVFKNVNGDIESLNYSGMIAPLYVLVNDLYTQIDELKKKLEV